MTDVPNVLTVAGTDPSGGAGIPVDLQVFRDHGCHGLSAVAAVVSQNTSEVRGFMAVEAERLEAQLEAVYDDIDVAAVKTGMLATPENVRRVAARVDALGEPPPLVVDPVLAGGGEGVSLAESGLVSALREELVPRASVVTPNIPEMEALAEIEVEGREGLRRAGRRLCEIGARAALLKTGHLPDAVPTDRIVDVLAYRDDSGIEIETLAPLQRVDADVRGTGCQLSSAIAARLAAGVPIREAVEGARDYLNRLLRTCIGEVGRGRPIVVRGGDGPCGEAP